ncbi:OmpA family protein [Polyangium mundeleinium]|uniref:OmpA family protein n=1 Tax=Polyangium mundeleinium TaxID=2995306 RepID=A0ABT5EDQ7_9BACT|nr:OmpA family protein [Polyangium mundeleinium]MDC0739948.1 OmpA family protein [Polyangium mundeleinium]
MRRTRILLRLPGALFLAARFAPALFVAACASAPPPAPLTEADRLLARKDTGDIKIARPELVAEARDLLRRAKAAHNIGDSERAALYAYQAIQLFTTAKNLAERDEAERLLRVVDKAAGESEEERRKAELEARLKNLEEQSKSSPEAARAMRAIDRAHEKQLAALEKGATGGSAGVYFQQGQALLEVALDAFEVKSYAEAANAGQSAAASFVSAIGSVTEKDKEAAAAPGGETPVEPRRAEETNATRAGTANVEAPRAAPPRPRAGGTRAAAPSIEELADRTLVSLELRRAEALGEQKDQRCPGPFREMDAMLVLAQKRFQVADYEHAYEYALRADERLRACDKLGLVAAAMPAAATQAGQKRAEDAEETARKKAVVAIQKAQVESARAQVANPNDPGVLQGNLLLSNADAWLGRRSYEEAEDFANRALAVLSKVKAPEPAKVAAKPAAPAASAASKPAPAPPSATQPTQPQPPQPTQPQAPVYVVQSPPPVPPAPPGTTVRIVDERSAAREEQFLAARLQQMEQALAQMQQQKQGPVDASWRPAYERVFRALSLRDRARLRSPDAKKRLDEADALLAQSRAAWQAKRHADAMRLADDASALLEPLAEVTADRGSPEELEERTRKADALIREASVGQQVCEKEACGDRDLAGHASAKELLASARQAYVDRRFGYAIELAGKAKEQFSAALQKPRKDASDPKIAAEKLEALREAADSSLREANITKKICETRNCRAIDGEAWIRATEYMVSAQAAYVDKRYEVVKDLADKADKIFKDTIAKQPEFLLPAGVTRVARFGSQLRLNPPVKFSKGTTLTPASEVSLDELAKVLIENKAVYKRVSLIGFTDGWGAAATNKKLSADRAAAVRDALIQRGVSAELLSSEGRGAESPIANNNTPQGREDNRRIEIHMELVEGIK